MDDKIITQTQETKEPKKKKFDQEKAPVVKTLVEVTEKVAEKKAEGKPEEKSVENIVEPIETPVKAVKVEAPKQKGKVVSVSPYRIIVCDKKGNNVRINGKFNVKVGDEYTF